MSLAELDQQRHAEERGAILSTLQQEYGREKTSVRSLAGALDLLGYPMSVDGMQFSLADLAERGYIKGWRSDRARQERADTVVFAKLTADGLLLIDGLRAADPGVRF